MLLAALLAAEHSPTPGDGAVLAKVGYDNEASFLKAFKRTYGRSPGAFRTTWMA